METVKTVFVKKTNAEGKEEFVEVPLEDLDVREHPEHKKVLDEAIKNRKKLQQVTKPVEQQTPPDDTDTEEGSGEPTPAKPKQPVKPKEQPHIPTMDEILEEINKRNTAEAQKRATEEAARKSAIDAELAKHKLPESARPIVEQAINPAVMAEALAKGTLSFASNPVGGDNLSQTELDEILKRVDDRLLNSRK